MSIADFGELKSYFKAEILLHTLILIELTAYVNLFSHSNFYHWLNEEIPIFIFFI